MHLDVCLTIETFVLVGLDWVSTYDAIFFSMSHIHAYVLFHSYFWIVIVFYFLFLSLSISRINYAWHLSVNLLRLKTLLVPGVLLLISFPLFTFDFVMGRPNRTSLKTFINVAFIRSAMSVYWTFLTLLYPESFRLKDGNLFVRYP